MLQCVDLQRWLELLLSRAQGQQLAWPSGGAAQYTVAGRLSQTSTRLVWFIFWCGNQSGVNCRHKHWRSQSLVDPRPFVTNGCGQIRPDQTSLDLTGLDADRPRPGPSFPSSTPLTLSHSLWSAPDPELVYPTRTCEIEDSLTLRAMPDCVESSGVEIKLCAHPSPHPAIANNNFLHTAPSTIPIVSRTLHCQHVRSDPGARRYPKPVLEGWRSIHEQVPEA